MAAKKKIVVQEIKKDEIEFEFRGTIEIRNNYPNDLEDVLEYLDDIVQDIRDRGSIRGTVKIPATIKGI